MKVSPIQVAAPPRRPWLGLIVATVVTAMLFAPMLLSPPSGDSEVGILASISLVGLIAGLMVARRPDHPISWLLAATAFFGGIAGFASVLLPSGTTQLSWWQAVLAIVSGPAWYALLLMVLVMIPLLFPTGSPPPRLRWLPWFGGGGTAVFGLLWMVQEQFCTDWNAEEICLSSVSNPIGIAGVVNPEQSALGGVLYLVVMVGSSLLAVISLFVRFRRSGTVERQQVKWVAFSLSFFVGFFLLVEGVWMELLGQGEPPGYWLIQQLLWVTIPATIAVAILRFRLYEIDRLVSRTVSYAMVAAVLFAVYAGGVIAVQDLLPNSGDLAVAASTLAVVALFSPLRGWVQGGVDRRFNRRRYVAQRVVEAFSVRLRDAVDLTTVADDLQSVVATTVEPATTSVWLR